MTTLAPLAPAAGISVVSTWPQPSPLGPLSITAGPAGVRRVWFAATGAETGPADARTADAFDAYFAGDLQALDGLDADLSGCTDFSRAVLLALRGLGPSRLTSYGRLAAMVGRPGAARAVGRAVGSNPVPILIACHRVLGAGGSLGGYSGGLDTKRWLLAHEGLRPQPTGVASGNFTPSLPR